MSSTTSEALKRPATTDLAQPADKKSKALAVTTSPSTSMDTAPSTPTSVDPPTLTPRPQTSQVPSLAPSAGILPLLARNLSAPFPIYDTVEIIVLTTLYTNYFKYLYTDLVNLIYPDSTDAVAHLISDVDFVRVCRYLMKSRVDSLYSSISGRRPLQRIAIPAEFMIPKSLADVINGIGAIAVSNGALYVIPSPEPPPVDPLEGLSNVVTAAILNSFTRLVKAAHQRNFINVGYVSRVVAGTAWWLLTARESAAPGHVAIDERNVIVRGAFSEWTPSDAILSAIVQNQFNGTIGPIPASLWQTDTVRAVPAIRTTFNTMA